MMVTPSAIQTHRALAGWTRTALLAELERQGQGLDARELAGRSGLHATTVRFHLEILARAGLVRATLERQPRRGRPRQVWSVTGTGELATAGSGAYRLLAELLAGYLGAALPAVRSAGLEAGEVSGARLVRGMPPLAGGTDAEAVAAVTTLLDDLGFAPEAAPVPVDFRARGGAEVHLRHCPFLEVAVANPEVVCSAHLGLLRGALRELGAPITATRLDPLVEPSRCVVHLGREAIPASVP